MSASLVDPFFSDIAGDDAERAVLFLPEVSSPPVESSVDCLAVLSMLNPSGTPFTFSPSLPSSSPSSLLLANATRALTAIEFNFDIFETGTAAANDDDGDADVEAYLGLGVLIRLPELTGATDDVVDDADEVAILDAVDFAAPPLAAASIITPSRVPFTLFSGVELATAVLPLASCDADVVTLALGVLNRLSEMTGATDVVDDDDADKVALLEVVDFAAPPLALAATSIIFGVELAPPLAAFSLDMSLSLLFFEI